MKLHLIVTLAALAGYITYAETNTTSKSSRLNLSPEEKEFFKKSDLEAKRECKELARNMRSQAFSLSQNGISDYTPTKTWHANGTNDVKVLVCTDSMMIYGHTAPAFREFHFSKDGRLISISEIKEVRSCGKWNMLKHTAPEIRNTPARDR